MNKTAKTILIIILLVAIVGWFVYSNMFMDKYTGTFNLHDGGEWNSVDYELSEGEADKLKLEMTGPQQFKVTYNGEFDLRGILTLGNDAGESLQYELYVYRQWDMTDDSYSIESELNRLD